MINSILFNHCRVNNVFIVGQKWLAEQLLSVCLGRDDVQVAGVSSPCAADRLAVLAEQHGVPVVVHGRKLNDRHIPSGVDVILSAHAYCYVTPQARAKARLGAVGYHPSLLPAYRGRKAIANAIADRVRVTGGSLYQLDDGWDTGSVISQEKVFVSKEDTPMNLWKEKLAPLGLSLFAEFLSEVDGG